MSKTRKITIPKEVVKKLAYLSKKFKGLNIGNKSRNFWMVSQQDSESYEWDSFDIGINDRGELITCKQSGCSCNSYEFPQEGDSSYILKGELEIPWESYYTGTFEELDTFIEMTNMLHQLFKTGKYEVDEVIKLPNAEIRRAVIEYIGLENFIRKASPEVLDESKFGKLVRIKVSNNEEWGKPKDEDIVAVYVRDASTTRNYFLRVPPNTTTARQAVAWTFGLDEESYMPEKES